MKMKKRILAAAVLLAAFPFFASASTQPRTVIDLNGEWSFDQTEKAFPPKKYTRKIPVPGLVHLAVPKISQYDKFFRTDNEIESVNSFNFLERQYTPMYNWYSRKVRIDSSLEGQKIVLNILKSQYVTTVYVNGYIAGRAIECYTPLKFNISEFVKFGADNEIVIMTGDRAWLPSEAAGSTDKEKIQYLPGIWDDVFITATGEISVDKVLFLPTDGNNAVTVKALVADMNPPQMLYGGETEDEISLRFTIREKLSGKVVAEKRIVGTALRDNRTKFEEVIEIPSPRLWSPENPFLYEGEVEIEYEGRVTDRYADSFGLRTFEAKGKFFYLNGSKYYLRGSNITLQRFFEDPECGDLAWNREWVKTMLIDNPKSIDWNAMRICVGIVPDFWYDLCDQYGIVLQNEWFYWQKHGWNDQIRKEYTDWVWSDGNHPSIVIWDAINENWDDYIGKTLIPELKRLDPTRVWDAGYMTSGSADEMDEPHPYRANTSFHLDDTEEYFAQNPYTIGRLDDWDEFADVLDAGVPQLVNEYGWIWLWRDGRPSKLTVTNYDYYVGHDATPARRRELQAYWLQMETEWLRSSRSLAGVLAFCTLTNNYGFTGDWYIGSIKDLEMGPTYRWFKHCFAPEAVFIDLPDSRYTRHVAPIVPGAQVPVNLVGITDRPVDSEGLLKVRIYDSDGTVVSSMDREVVIPAYGKANIPTILPAPEKAGGYLIAAEYTPSGSESTFISRRFVKVGNCPDYKYYELEP